MATAFIRRTIATDLRPTLFSHKVVANQSGKVAIANAVANGR